MINKLFSVITNEEKRIKLKTAIQSKAGEHLTSKEVKAIVLATPPKMQYAIQIYYEPAAFCKTLSLTGRRKSKIVLGNFVPGTPSKVSPEYAAAFITKNNAAGKEFRQIHIYIPAQRLQKGCDKGEQ